ncbi:protoporphyrinogen oxidase [Granulicella tundricola]|uniref:Coproporphyrinogen III oxidase n=1 Tax=Granulicella tundricola (strain ATCC BAA-1859 / DSM 23138 / MP5ACTX9) TaxID=1198114 RepID=E8X3F2_GRATM|nr:protoporphyrinogen oxidase [Granulicella tundricola]ADW70453.1 protoporphyrinogen oxidase [Granulicella tundricola MP5ACTX9]
MKRIAIIGGGIAGLTCAWQLHQLGQPFTLYEATPRLGGTVRTLHRDGFTIEQGPDGWVTEKPWAAELARDLGLGDELTPSNDAGRVTWIVRDNKLMAMPDGMRMMVPTDLLALEGSPLFSDEARAAYAAEPARAEELRAAAPDQDESIAAFVLRHYGHEVLNAVAAPLLAGVFGGDVWKLSVRAVMPRFVEMERQHGSLITALQSLVRRDSPSIFTTLASGLGTLIDRMAAALPAGSVRMSAPINSIPDSDHIILATPAHVIRTLLRGLAPERAVELLPAEASSAVLVALAFDEEFALPAGFGFLVPHSEPSQLLAATFVDQKFPGRVPPGKRLLRAFFGGANGLALTSLDDGALAALAHAELVRILGPLPVPAFSTVQRWPLSLPQYEVGHLDRMTELAGLLPSNVHLLGNAYRGVGLPDLIRDARALARQLTS